MAGTPTADLPDLVITRMYIELETGSSCAYTSTRLGVRVEIANTGTADAGPFVVEVNGAQQTVEQGLARGQTLSLWFAGYAFSSQQRAFVDATFQVEESNEDNNELVELVPIPTLPAPCTPTPTPTVTPTPTPVIAAGDVDCNRRVNAIDATLILQFDAHLLLSLACQAAADVNEDGRISSVDAFLLLQYHAGLLDSLPV
ncbi:MAG: hypothetical protein A2148_11390 [Chloroflexi bacterium RBG_16_68_14]|nr:MAG: hypothetical protein A2148_11390 [Chloroflexi bacterium RBG_16_68_14]